ncbi:hypothetical protein BCR37DRAFT_381650 [Protomyces lactucae-debilis]|uniref:Uncharacterized protein n=1 Tax=Protomyces lactucae-debilis TaxID=2754530 RepID=A0A1Y2F738_PROLT|nr:uncharacterized protein BCR37DRAFT_381650 [Protomyces lactucae-debilis]ORY79467.1 hypothetical protein BCR37DRAFT_381650 [Protomyces lactucae-debilis]
MFQDDIASSGTAQLCSFSIDSVAQQSLDSATLKLLRSRQQSTSTVPSRSSSIRQSTPFPQSLFRRVSPSASVKEPSSPQTRKNSTVSARKLDPIARSPSPTKSVRFSVPATSTPKQGKSPGIMSEDISFLTKTSSRFSPAMIPANHSKTPETWRYDFYEDRMCVHAVKELELYKLDWSAPLDQDKLQQLASKACSLFLHSASKDSEKAAGYFSVFAYLSHRLVYQLANTDNMDKVQCLYPTSVVRCMVRYCDSDGSATLQSARELKLFGDYHNFTKGPAGR